MRTQTQFRFVARQLTLATALLLSLTACGGGGSDSGMLTNSQGTQNDTGFSSSSSSSSSSSGANVGDNAIPIPDNTANPDSGQVVVRPEVANPELSPTGSSAITLYFENTDGEAVATMGSWVATSACVAEERSVLTEPVYGLTTLAYNYTAAGCDGTDIVHFQGDVNGSIVSVQAPIEIATDTVSYLSWVSTEPSQLTIKMTGNQEMAEVTFRINGTELEGVPNQLVEFRIDGEAGDLLLESIPGHPVGDGDVVTGTSDAEGFVSVRVRAGTTPAVITVVARHVETGEEKASGGLLVASGLPVAGHFNMALDNYNPAAWSSINKGEVNVTVAVSDKSGNPVVDGTVVNFVSEEGGTITPSCLTVNNTCTVQWKTDGRQPDDGRVQVFATVKGTENFFDWNSNKMFDEDEFDAIFDLGEPYADHDSSGQYERGEYFVDSNNSGERDGPDGKWNGINCQYTRDGGVDAGATHCHLTRRFVDLGAQQTIVMSNDKQPTICSPGDFPPASGSISVATGETLKLDGLYLSDGNESAVNDDSPCAIGNPLPKGSTVAFSSSIGQLYTKTEWEVGDASRPTGPYGISLIAPGQIGNGLLTMTVSSGDEVREWYWDIEVSTAP